MLEVNKESCKSPETPVTLVTARSLGTTSTRVPRSWSARWVETLTETSSPLWANTTDGCRACTLELVPSTVPKVKRFLTSTTCSTSGCKERGVGRGWLRLAGPISYSADLRPPPYFSPEPSIYVSGSLRQSSRMPFLSLFRFPLSPLPFSNGPIRLRRYPFLVFP